MKITGRVKFQELWVGILILFAFAVLLWASFTGTGFTVLAKHEPFVTYFSDVEGLLVGSPVRIAGIEVGHVQAVEFVERDGQPMVHVDFVVTESTVGMITADAHAAIGTMGLLGDKYLSITLGSMDAPLVQPGGEIAAAQAADLTSILSSAPDLLHKVDNAVGELSDLLNRLNRGEGFIGELVVESETSANLDTATAAAKSLLANLRDSQAELTSTLQQTARNLDQLVTTIEAGNGTMGRLVQDTALYANLTAVTARADRLLNRLDRGEGTAGHLVSDDAVYVEIRTLLGEMQALIDDMKQNPKKYFKVSLF